MGEAFIKITRVAFTIMIISCNLKMLKIDAGRLKTSIIKFYAFPVSLSGWGNFNIFLCKKVDIFRLLLV